MLAETSRDSPVTGVTGFLDSAGKSHDQMKIQVLFYAQLRDLVGMRQLDVDIADGATVRDLLEQLYAHEPKLRQHDKSILIGVGLEFVDRNFKLSPGNEISIMPPVQGG